MKQDTKSLHRNVFSALTFIVSLFISACSDTQPITENKANTEAEKVTLAQEPTTPQTYPIQQAGTLYLNTPALPDTVATQQPEWSYFAWNTFIAMNWPALETTPNQYRGVPNTSKSFATANNDDLTVWETIKEKREVFNHPSTPGTLQWYSPVDYGDLRLADGSSTVTNQRTFHQNSGTSATPDGLDETVEVQSQALEQYYPDGTTANPVYTAVPPVVTPRVWKGPPSDKNPIVYEVKVNYDYFKYVVEKGYNADNAVANNAISMAADAAKIKLPYRTSSSSGAGANTPVTGYRANKATAAFTAINAIYQYNQQNPGSPKAVPLPPLEGAVQVKAAWVKLGGSSAVASNYPTWHTAVAQYYEDENGDIVASEASLFGLVGMHIIQRIHTTTSRQTAANPTGGTFIFSTWEHDSIYNSPAKGSTDTGQYYYSNYFGGSPLPPPSSGFYPPLTQDIYPVKRMYPVLSNVIDVNTAVHSAISKVNASSVWLNYHLVGTQFKAMNVTDAPTTASTPPYPVSANDPTGIGQPLFLANLAIETNTGLQHFQGQPPTIRVIDHFSDKIASNTALGFNRNSKNMAFNGSGYNMGGCMGCHGVAQSKGYAFSFVLLDGYLGAATDTQDHFDQPGANPTTLTGPPTPGPMDIKSARVIPDNASAPSICPTVCTTLQWNGQWRLASGSSVNFVCVTASSPNVVGSYEIPVGFFDGQAGANAHCQQQISKVTWNGQWSNYPAPRGSVCGCQPPTPVVPAPAP